MNSNELTHLDAGGNARMVDLSPKSKTERYARARAEVILSESTINKIKEGLLHKGDVLTIAKIAGIFAAKHTSSLIPLCHPIMLDKIDINLSLDAALPGVIIETEVATFEKTGVEMEALTAASVAALTIYDMVKSVERGAIIRDIRLLEKRGGKSGVYRVQE